MQKKSEYLPINIFKSNSTLNLVYNEVVLKEGEQISLISKNFPEGFYDNAYAWRTSDPDIAEIVNGVITAKKAGKITIAAIQTYPFDFKYNLFATVEVVSQESQDGSTVQTISQSNLIGFSDPDVVPQITISSNEDINATTTVTNCFDVLDGKIEMVGQPIDVQTSSDFKWAEISFTLSQDQLNSIDINDLVIYWYDDENGAIIPQATKVDASTGKVSAVVTHFSKYFLSYFCIQNETINIAFLIDSYYGNQESLNIYKGNYFEYNYTIPSIGNYSIEIRASNMPSPYGTEYAVSNILSFTAVTAETWYDTIKDIEELTSGYHEFFVKELESKVYVYITDPAKEKITFSIGKLNKHETVSEIVDASGLKPIVAMNAGFFDMCVYYDENYPEWGKKKGEMRIDNNDVEQHGVLIINGEELETVSMKRWVDVEEDEATKKRMKYLKKKRYTKKE